MTKTTASGFRDASCSRACFGQSKKSGVSSPLDTRESYCGATTPVFAVSSPSEGPTDPARESPAIQSRSGASGLRLRWACFLAAVVLDVVEDDPGWVAA